MGLIFQLLSISPDFLYYVNCCRGNRIAIDSNSDDRSWNHAKIWGMVFFDLENYWYARTVKSCGSCFFIDGFEVPLLERKKWGPKNEGIAKANSPPPPPPVYTNFCRFVCVLHFLVVPLYTIKCYVECK